MFIRLLFWFVLFYFLLTFILRVLLPVIMASRNVRSKMKEMNENMKDFQSSAHPSSTENNYNKSASTTSSSKGDYIDFEEIK